MGLEKQQTGDPPSPQRGAKAPGAAPPSRQASYGGAPQTKGYISPEVVKRAEWMGITPQELQAGIEETDRTGGWENGNPYRRG